MSKTTVAHFACDTCGKELRECYAPNELPPRWFGVALRYHGLCEYGLGNGTFCSGECAATWVSEKCHEVKS